MSDHTMWWATLSSHAAEAGSTIMQHQHSGQRLWSMRELSLRNLFFTRAYGYARTDDEIDGR